MVVYCFFICSRCENTAETCEGIRLTDTESESEIVINKMTSEYFIAVMLH